MIYILCPANLATGGPELLHQLGYKLNLLGYVADMFYVNKIEGMHPVCEQYEKYHVPFSHEVYDLPGNIIIIPETRIDMLYETKNYISVIWWLSVDNATYTDEDIDYMKNAKNVLHLVQSQYALDFLHNTLDIHNNIYYLSDYINSDFFSYISQDGVLPRTDTVLFNPKKGISKTVELIAKSDYRIKWQALSGLTPKGMCDVMQQAKVYIDFGNHPGKDRIPREATICGCHIITNKKGSAYNDVDVAIPACYKFDDAADTSEILDCIYNLIENYDEKHSDYETYLDKISNEFIEFEKDIVKFFSLLIKDNISTFNTAEEYIQHMIQSTENGNYALALRYLIDYRIKEFEENITIDIIETIIRIGIEEYQEARLCALRGLKKDPKNYELYLNLAHIALLTNNMDECHSYCEKAIEYSCNSPDETYIKNTCLSFLGEEQPNASN